MQAFVALARTPGVEAHLELQKALFELREHAPDIVDDMLEDVVSTFELAPADAIAANRLGWLPREVSPKEVVMVLQRRPKVRRDTLERARQSALRSRERLALARAEGYSVSQLAAIARTVPDVAIANAESVADSWAMAGASPALIARKRDEVLDVWREVFADEPDVAEQIDANVGN